MNRFSPSQLDTDESRRATVRGVLFAIAEYTVIAILVLSYNTVWTRSGALYDNIAYVRLGASAMALVIPAVSFIRFPRFKLRLLPLFVIAVIGFCVSVFLTGNFKSSLMSYAPVLMAVLYAESLQTRARVDEVLNRFVNVITVLAVVSLLFFLFGTTLHIISPTGYISYDWEILRTGNSYYSLYFETQNIDFFGYSGCRNNGVFPEAPMFSFVLTLAFAANVLLLKGSIFKSLVLGITVFTTFSTTGYLAVLIVFVYLLAVAKTNARLLSALRIVAIPVVLVLAAFVMWLIVGDKLSTGSYDVRSDHLSGCTQLFLSYLPLGTGFGNSSAFQGALAHEQGLSVGTMYLLAQGGVFSVLLYVFPTFYALYVSIARRDFALLTFVIMITWVVFVTQVVYQPIFWLFVFVTLWRLPQLKAEKSTVRKRYDRPLFIGE